MKVVIIEDEKLSAEHLQMMLKKIDAQIEIIAVIDSVRKSVAVFKEGLQADLLFLDIHLGDGLSFELLNQVNVNMPIVFTTAFDEYAIKAFKHNSIDYLLKPVSTEDLRNAVEKFKQQQQVFQSNVLRSLQASFAQVHRQFKKRFLVKVGSAIDTIEAQQVHHFKTIDSITFLVLENGKRFAIDYTLDDLTDILDPQDFFRINRKTILHIQSIEKVNAHFNSRLHISAKHVEDDFAIVSRERVQELKQWLDK
jgi:DNA-binding LytR/AlgR family response regulator